MTALGAQAYGSFGSDLVEFTAAHREFNDTPAEVQVTMTFPMSYEDIAATLYLAVRDGAELSELDDDGYVRKLVLDLMLNDPADNIQDAALEIAEARPGTTEYALVQAIRARVAEVFSPVRTSAPSPRREMAGVNVR